MAAAAVRSHGINSIDVQVDRKGALTGARQINKIISTSVFQEGITACRTEYDGRYGIQGTLTRRMETSQSRYSLAVSPFSNSIISYSGI